MPSRIAHGSAYGSGTASVADLSSRYSEQENWRARPPHTGVPNSSAAGPSFAKLALESSVLTPSILLGAFPVYRSLYKSLLQCCERILLLWMLAVLVCHRLLLAYFETGKEIERAARDWLPPFRNSMKSPGCPNAVRKSIAGFYAGLAAGGGPGCGKGCMQVARPRGTAHPRFDRHLGSSALSQDPADAGRISALNSKHARKREAAPPTWAAFSISPNPGDVSPPDQRSILVA